jgi:biopolymer transport protein ExbD
MPTLRSSRREGQAADLNLVPIMNLMAMLIPVLLVASQYVRLAVIEGDVSSPGPGADQAELRPFELSLGVSAEGLHLFGADALLVKEGVGVDPSGRPIQPTLPCRGGACSQVDDYDWQGLQRLLGRIKDEHPSADRVVLIPDVRVRYEVLVRAMDMSRELPVEGQGMRPLFPEVVLAPGARR